MTIGIDKIAFHVPQYYLDMTDLAHARNVDPAKFHIGIGQDQMAVIPKTQDIITLAANASQKILSDTDKQLIDMVIVGTESGNDFSKSSAVILHHLLGIQPFARSYEIKQACYGGTAALMQAYDYLKSHPQRKVLVVATDIAKYGLNSGGEPTQGCGAVAMLISHNPRILALNNDNVFYSQDVYDFWRPTGHDYPLVDGHLSNAVYIEHFNQVWQQATKVNQTTASDYAALTFHLPYTKMGRKALNSVLPTFSEADQLRLTARYEEAITYSRKVGNLYTGSLYLGLVSLLENSTTLKAGDRLGLFSYGSGAVSEFFSGTLVAGYQKALESDQHQRLLATRKQLTIAEYEAMFRGKLPTDGGTYTFDDATPFAIQALNGDVRRYKS
jgi:hydroxymethylglutaryl-CoA synthase